MSKFAHLHLHSQYSVLDGAAKIERIVKKVKDLGQTAVGLTDHGCMHGAVEFYSKCKEFDVKPILGCEVYFTTGDRRERKPKSQGGSPTHHLTLLARDMQGYKNLCKMVSLGYSEGFYFKPRIDEELLRALNPGIICLSGCISSHLASATKREDEKKAADIAEKYLDIFGDRYFLEVQPHKFGEQKTHNEVVTHLASKIGVPLVLTNDCHYVDADDSFAHEVLMCVGTGKNISDADRMSKDGTELHIKSREEIGCFEEAMDNTMLIADQVDLNFDFGTYHMPRFEVPKEKTLDDVFREESHVGLRERVQNPSQEYIDRLDEEINIIISMGFAGYFLVVADFIKWAKQNDVPVGPGRGSAAGSLVAYVLEITEIDPIKYKLLFERFLNPERVSMPDIDIDFCINGRERVVKYVREKYGQDRVANIATFGTLKAKAAIKDVGRALGMTYGETDRVAKLVPAPRQGFDYPLEQALKMEPKLKEYAEGDGKQLIEIALRLEGLTRHTSTHAAGVVISDVPLVEHCPLFIDKDGQTVTQFSMNWVEKIGLVKFDFLGLKTLTVIAKAVELVKESTGEKIDINDLPLEDKRTFEMLSAGRTVGVFQLESSGITEMITRLRPTDFEDIVAILALYRPGPLDSGMADQYIQRKHGRSKVQVPHQSLEKILKDTFGIILYQEQIMQIARDMAGYSLGEADMLRRAMGKKKPEEMAKQRKFFMTGALKKEIAEKVAEEVFDQMETFARYGFNRSHSVAYAMISYQTAFLKAHYPVCFMAAIMTLEKDATDKVLKNLNECRKLKIKVEHPDVNTGQVGFSVKGKTIIFGLSAIKGIGEKVVEAIAVERQANGPFEGLLDLCRRVDAGLLNKRTLENLIFCGAFDFTGISRKEHLEHLDPVLRLVAREKKEKDSNQIGLFGSADVQYEDLTLSENASEWSSKEKLQKERSALGFYLSGHPLEHFQSEIALTNAKSVSDLYRLSDATEMSAAGMVTMLKLKNTKKGDRYATFVLEDMERTIEVLVWPDTYIKVGEILAGEQPVVVKGKLDVSDERRCVIASEVRVLSEHAANVASQMLLKLPVTSFDQSRITKLKKILSTRKGTGKVQLLLEKQSHSVTVINLGDEYKVDLSEELITELEEEFGEASIKLA